MKSKEKYKNDGDSRTIPYLPGMGGERDDDGDEDDASYEENGAGEEELSVLIDDITETTRSLLVVSYNFYRSLKEISKDITSKGEILESLKKVQSILEKDKNSGIERKILLTNILLGVNGIFTVVILVILLRAVGMF